MRGKRKAEVCPWAGWEGGTTCAAGPGVEVAASIQGCGVSTQPAAPVAPLLLVEERGGILEILWGVVKLDCEICDGRPELASCLLEASPGVEVSATTRDMRCG